MASIRTAGLAKNFGDLRAVNEIDLDLPEGGLAGIVGSILMVVTFVAVGVFVGDASPTAVRVERFPEIRAAHTVENSLFLAVVILWAPSFLALYRALWRESLAPALFGSVLGIMSLVIWASEGDSAGSPEDREDTGNGVRAEDDSSPSKYLDAVQQGR